jgi:Ca2+-transporting ATPase
MGESGTDVAREASHLVLLDDNFATIVAAVRQGRRIFDNLQKFVRFALAGNAGEILTLVVAPLVGMSLPLLPIHILWVNLVTDGLPGLALSLEPAERDVMKRRPRPPKSSLFAQGGWQYILILGAVIGGVSLAAHSVGQAISPESGYTLVFTVLAFGQMGLALSVRSREPVWRSRFLSNPALLGAVALTVLMQLLVIYVPAFQPVFHTRPLSGLELAGCFGAGIAVCLIAECVNVWQRRLEVTADSGPVTAS